VPAFSFLLGGDARVPSCACSGRVFLLSRYARKGREGGKEGRKGSGGRRVAFGQVPLHQWLDRMDGWMDDAGWYCAYGHGNLGSSGMGEFRVETMRFLLHLPRTGQDTTGQGWAGRQGTVQGGKRRGGGGAATSIDRDATPREKKGQRRAWLVKKKTSEDKGGNCTGLMG
jgi:hypothetical protein